MKLEFSFAAVPHICYLSLKGSTRESGAFNIESHSQIEIHTGSTLRCSIGQNKVLAISHRTKCARKICSLQPADSSSGRYIWRVCLSTDFFGIQRCPLAHPPMPPSTRDGAGLEYVSSILKDFLTGRVEIEIYHWRICLLNLPAGKNTWIENIQHKGF